MAAGVPRGKDAAGGTCRSKRDSGVLKSQGQGGKEDPERGVGSGAGGPQDFPSVKRHADLDK